jgi:hypothetical protein
MAKTTPTDPRALAIQHRDRVKAAYIAKLDQATANYRAAEEAVKQCEFSRLVAARDKAKHALDDLALYGKPEGDFGAAGKAVQDLMPPQLALALDAVAREWQGVNTALQQTYVHSPGPPAGTRAGLERRLKELEAGKRDLERIASEVIDWQPALDSVLSRLHLVFIHTEAAAVAAAANGR